MRLPKINERIDYANYPHLKPAGIQILKELEYQQFDNPKWLNSERAWWHSMRLEFLATVSEYEEEIQVAYMKGVQATQEQLFDDGDAEQGYSEGL